MAELSPPAQAQALESGAVRSVQHTKPLHSQAAALHIPSLDGIRAISFLLVFVAHCGLEDVVPGGLGVTVFFFLSGYLITTLLRTEYERHSHIKLRHFWLRRGLRILPPFYLVLLIAYALPLLNGTFSTANALAFMAQALHISNYWVIAHGYTGFPEYSGTGVYWSLAVEEHFYLVFPFLYLLLRRQKLVAQHQAAVITLMCGLVLLWRFYLTWNGTASPDRTYMGSDTRLDSILFGCLLAVYHNPMLDPRHGTARTWAVLLLPLAALLLLCSLLVRNEVFRETLRYSLQGVALLLVFSAAIRYPYWPLFRWLNTRPMKLLGTLSYSLYLVHLGVIYTVRDALHVDTFPALVALSLAIAVLLAWLIYQWVEKPCAALRRRLLD